MQDLISDEEVERHEIIIIEYGKRNKLQKNINFSLENERKFESKRVAMKNVKLFADFIIKFMSDNPELDKYRDIFEKTYDEFFEDREPSEEDRDRKHSEEGKSSKEDTKDPPISKCPYAILGLPYGTSLEKCREEFKKQALQLHPDRNFDKTEEQKKKNLELFKLKSAAMDVIEASKS